ncbi:MAG: PQQ-dependent sugar dehydrogenase [Kofleriaceae bacterium]|jgi:glucose/arabinose dehydrogenase|nr:PQQ-dependent sugar dehydrogenase [Kofleriaceae bacterium]
MFTPTLRSALLSASALALAACGDDGGATPAIDAPVVPTVDAALWDAAGPTCTQSGGTNVAAVMITDIPQAALLVTAPAGDRRLFIVGRDGGIFIYDQGALLPQPFLDIGDGVGLVAGGEQGLLGLAFHPDYLRNRRFFVYYTTSNANVIAEYTASAADPNQADPTGQIVLSVPDFAGNHNGGMIEFGRDGLLYIGTGDGGGGGDPQENGQDPTDLLGKLLRVDVDNVTPPARYSVPAGNPFAAGGGAGEIFALGLRNPWRWTFDPSNDDLYIGDVGQGEIEEVDVLPLASAAGANFGWDQYEGSQCFEPPCDPAGKTLPVVEFTHGQGWCSVIGGAVYRGTCFPDLVGRYFYTDYCAGGLQSFVYAGGAATERVDHDGAFPGGPTSLHPDGLGELYLTSENGNVYRLEATP